MENTIFKLLGQLPRLKQPMAPPFAAVGPREFALARSANELPD
jgi:hypothetical protein